MLPPCHSSNNKQWSLHPTSLAKANPRSALHYLCNNAPTPVPSFLSFPQWTETPRNSLPNWAWSGVINLRVWVSSHLSLPSFRMFLWLFPGSTTVCVHPSFRPGPKFRNHQTCRAWMGARLPYRNTYHKGIYPFVEQTRHYAPDEIGCLFWWADHFHGHSFISILLERSPRVPLSFSTFHASHSLLLCSISRLTALVLFIYYLFYFLPRSVSPLRSRVSPFLLLLAFFPTF